jgi:type I restriction enzyme M protein
MEFDFMLSNPPYGKSWKTDLERMGGKKELSPEHAARFTAQHQGEELSLITRSSDGQLMFLVNKLTKKNHATKLGSRIAEVHNGSSLFTGDAGQGESNIRRWIIENDWCEAIIALPLNMFYNTGIATYIWVLTNRKPVHRKGKVQLIDATGISTPLRKNLGKKNCELSDTQIRQITEIFLSFKESDQSKIFPNAAFGYWKVVVERPLRLKTDLSTLRREQFRKACEMAKDKPLANLVDRVADRLGVGPHLDFNKVLKAVKEDAEKHSVKMTAKRIGLLKTSLAERDESAEPVVKKVYKPGRSEEDPIRGFYASPTGEAEFIETYEPDSALRDTEQVPLLEDGGIDAFFLHEVLPHVPDAWIDESKTQIGYEISFTRHFYKPTPMRSLDEIKADLEALQNEADGLLDEIVGTEKRG